MKTGIYVPLVTPFKENYEVDYDVLAEATKFVLKKGADGIYACGGTSEFSLLTKEERKRCLEVIIENAGGKEVIAHVGSQSMQEALELSEHAHKAGASMLSAVAPYYYGYSFSQVKEYFTAIAHATPLSLMVYNAVQARPYSLDEMRELLKDEKISAIKYTGYNFFTLERLISSYPDKNFFTGADEVFLSGQAVGATGAIGTTYNYFADKYILARKLNDVTEAILTPDGLLATVKYIMSLQGLNILPISRPPFTAPNEKLLEKVKAAYEKSEEWFSKAGY